MKQKYMKPVLHIEQFGLLQTIAANCNLAYKDQVTFNNIDDCGFQYIPGSNEMIVFVSEPVCNMETELGTEGSWNICYNAPDANSPIVFRS